MATVFFDKDISTDILKNKKIGVIGYGNQGRAQALNLRDSGFNVCVGIREKSPTIKNLNNDNISYDSIENVVVASDVISILVPDSKAPYVFNQSINPHLTKGKALLFSHGYNVYYKLINCPKFIDVIMVAPSGGGAMLRKEYVNNSGIPALLAVEQNYTGNALELAKAYSKAIGSSRICSFLSTFKEETETDLYGEQSILTGGLPMMIEKSLKVLLEDGYSPVVAWFVCYYEIKMIVDLFHEKGFDFLYRAISDTARYGGITRGDYLIDENIETKMKHILAQIKDGSFHDEMLNN